LAANKLEASSPPSLVVSPFSLACCLALAQAGARGKTAEELTSLLAGNNGSSVSTEQLQAHYGELFQNLVADDVGPVFRVADRIYLDSSNKVKLNKEFVALISRHYRGLVGAEALDFSDGTKAASVRRLIRGVIQLVYFRRSTSLSPS
jgi:serine protease inhibitor